MSTRVSSRFSQIGLDRLVRLRWLERTATLAIAGNSGAETKSSLHGNLRNSFPASDVSVRGSINKTITILMKVWLRPPGYLRALHLAGLNFLAWSPESSHLAVHWGMVMAVYPFWAGVATQVGRLLKLQGRVVAAQVQRRLREQYGERETVSRAARRVLRSYVDWNVLKETGVKGIYGPAPAYIIEDSKLIAWLIEASLHARSGGSGPLKELIGGPALFPFHIRPVHGEELSAESGNLQVVRHGLEEEFVMLGKLHSGNGAL